MQFISIFIGLLSIVSITTAQAQEVESNELYKKQCITALRITPALAEVGTYSLRIDECIADKEYAELNLSRRGGRTQARIEEIKERITTDNRARISRVIPPIETYEERFDRFQEINSAENAYRMLEQNRTTTRESIYQRAQTRDTGYDAYKPVVTPSVLERRITYTRPSRRLIKEDALMQTRSSRFESGDVYQEELLRALDACSEITNNFHRNNCIRTEQRKTGSQ